MLTVAHLVESFRQFQLAEVKAGIAKTSTAEWYQYQFAPLVGKCGFMPAADVRPHHIVNVRYTNAFCKACKRLFTWGADEGFLQGENLRKLKIPPVGKRERILTRSEFVRLLAKLPRHHRDFLLVMRRTLARPGELRNLRWDDIDFEARVMVLTEFKGKSRRADGLKRRGIPLDAYTMRMLRRWGDRRRHGEDFVFGGRQPLKANCISLAVRRARRKAGLPEGIVPYTTRHTAATTAIENGVSLSHVAGIMGHSRVSTTERYVHLNAKHLVAVIDQATAKPRPRLRLVS